MNFYVVSLVWKRCQDMIGSWPSILVSTVENEVRTQNNDCRYVFFKFLQLDIFSAETMQRFQSVLIFIVYVASVCSYLKWCESHSVRLNICYKVWVWFSLQFMSCFQSCFPRNGQLKYMGWFGLLVHYHYVWFLQCYSQTGRNGAPCFCTLSI